MSMDEEAKSLLKEIRDETRKTNKRIDELKSWALSEIEKERASSETYNQATGEFQKILPKRDIWGLLIIGVVFAAFYFSREHLK